MYTNHFDRRLFSSVLNKIIPDNNIPTFEEAGGVTQPHIICRRYINLSWYLVNLHKID